MTSCIDGFGRTWGSATATPWCMDGTRTTVEVILRLLLWKHLYGWSYEETRERVANSLVLRWFCRVYFQTVLDKSPLIRWTHTLCPETLHGLNDRVVELTR